MEIIFQENVAEIDIESPTYAPELRSEAALVPELRRLAILTDSKYRDQAAELVDELFREHFSGVRWYYARQRERWKRLQFRQFRPFAIHNLKLTWRQSLEIYRRFLIVERRVLILQYARFTDAILESGLRRDNAYYGIVGTDIAEDKALLLALECYVRPSTVPRSLATGRMRFFAMPMADSDGVDVYWHCSNKEITAAAEKFALK